MMSMAVREHKVSARRSLEWCIPALLGLLLACSSGQNKDPATGAGTGGTLSSGGAGTGGSGTGGQSGSGGSVAAGGTSGGSAGAAGAAGSAGMAGGTPTGNLFVAPNGDDGNPGTIEQP